MLNIQDSFENVINFQQKYQDTKNNLSRKKEKLYS
jgi:hypothetical protein